jgi:small subunit ribosomal protein S17
MSAARNIGIPVNPPTRVCDDKDCPFHGSLKVRGILLRGQVLKVKMNKTAVIEREKIIYVRKYKRYMRRRTRILVHLPPCLSVKPQDQVIVGECRPISKNVSFVVLGKVM